MLVSSTDAHLPGYRAPAVTPRASCLGVGFKSRSGDRVSGPNFILLDQANYGLLLGWPARRAAGAAL